MSKPKIQARIDPAVKERLDEHIHEHFDSSHGAKSETVENALREYLDMDRAARTEKIVHENRETLEEVRSLLEEHTAHAHTSSSTATTTTSNSLHSLTQPEKTDILVDYLDREFDDALSTQELETAIEEAISVGGRTQADYKDHLKQRGALFADPREDVEVWFRSRTDFFERVRAHAATTRTTHKELLAEYDHSLLPDYREWLKDELAAEVPDHLTANEKPNPNTADPYPVSTAELEEAIATTAGTERWVTDIRQRIREQEILEQRECGWAPPGWELDTDLDPNSAETDLDPHSESGPTAAAVEESEPNTPDPIETLASEIAHDIVDDRDAWPAETAYLRAIVRRELGRDDVGEGIDVEAIITAIRAQDVLEERAVDEWVPTPIVQSDHKPSTTALSNEG